MRFEYCGNISDQLQSVHRDIIDSSNKWRNIGCSGSGCQDCLRNIKNQCQICFDPFTGQYPACLQALSSSWKLNNHILMDFCNFPAFFDHAFSINSCGFDFSADRTVNNCSNLLNYLIKVSTFFSNNRGIGSNTANNPHIICFFYFFDISRI